MDTGDVCSKCFGEKIGKLWKVREPYDTEVDAYNGRRRWMTMRDIAWEAEGSWGRGHNCFNCGGYREDADKRSCDWRWGVWRW